MWTFDCDAKMLVISGTGNMANYTEGTAPWYIHRTKINTVVIEEGVKTIGNYAFIGCYVNTLSLPSGLLSIGERAFSACPLKNTLIIPATVTIIGPYAFNACTQINTLRILGYVSNIGRNTFGYCYGLTSVLCASEVPPTCYKDNNNHTSFEGTTIANIKLYVPGQAMTDYQSAPVWQNFNIQASSEKRVAWVDEEGNELYVNTVAVGQVPEFIGEEPTKDADGDYVYTFAGWIPTYAPVVRDCNYVAHFVRTPKKFFNVGIGGANCALNVTNKVPEGTYLEVTVAPEDCYQFTQWSDGDNNNPRIIQVTEDTNISADCTKIIYTIEGQAQGSGAVTIAPKQ